MAWKLSESTFQIIPEGTYVFKITARKGGLIV